MKQITFMVLLTFFLLTGCQSSPSADWAYSFIVYHGDNYIVSDNMIPDEDLGKQINTVEVYSDQEVNVNPNKIFSNHFPAGSKIFTIKGKDDKTLAVQTKDGNFEVNYANKYGSKD
ncbi:hypothetical protein [Falsibacillus albus]|uniref:DUF3221 domain-containing protein n=1 Tax=Falsibacillus albus TaxID=2478915 RepID=A0A3L7JW80_9BACI|nr:hypothetical protein [Falsibacillus albus]RLQ94514.1 hypothetical protein D9X91_13295 [Falsibacillus albus]